MSVFEQIAIRLDILRSRVGRVRDATPGPDVEHDAVEPDAETSAPDFSSVLLERRELDWVPRSWKRWRTGLAVLIGMALSPLLLALARPVFAPETRMTFVRLILFGSLGVVALSAWGSWVALRVFALGKLGPARSDLRALRQLRPGSWVRVSGRVDGRRTIPAVTGADVGVFRRLLLNVDGLRVVLNDANDFDIVDDRGGRIRIRVEGARWIKVPAATWAPIPVECHQELLSEIPDDIAEPERDSIFTDRKKVNAETRYHKLAAAKLRSAHAKEWILRVGENVDVAGEITHLVDPDVEDRLPREEPVRIALASRPNRPLLLTPTARR